MVGQRGIVPCWSAVCHQAGGRPLHSLAVHHCSRPGSASEQTGVDASWHCYYAVPELTSERRATMVLSSNASSGPFGCPGVTANTAAAMAWTLAASAACWPGGERWEMGEGCSGRTRRQPEPRVSIGPRQEAPGCTATTTRPLPATNNGTHPRLYGPPASAPAGLVKGPQAGQPPCLAATQKSRGRR